MGSLLVCSYYRIRSREQGSGPLVKRHSDKDKAGRALRRVGALWWRQWPLFYRLYKLRKELTGMPSNTFCGLLFLSVY